MKKNRKLQLCRNCFWDRFPIYKGILLSMMCLLLVMPLKAQKDKLLVSIDVQQTDVIQIFKMLENMVNYKFMYHDEDIVKLGKKTLKLHKVPLKVALDSCIVNSNVAYEIVENMIIFKRQKSVRAAVYRGQVLDNDKVPLPGATVLLKGSVVGTTTDSDGKWKLQLPPNCINPILVFSFIGKESIEMPAKENRSMDVVLKDNVHNLEEVVSLGYYNVDKRHMTSAVTSLKMDDIMLAGVNTVDQMLEGHVPGMIFMQNSGQVGAAPKIKIRGTTTVLGAQTPLWVLDGVILTDPVNIDPNSINDLDFVNLLGNAISGINPSDIEKIDVLKDASATAIYGPKASNGVIVITTKKGKVGNPSVSYSVSGTFRRRPRYSDRAVHVMNSQERIDYSREIIDKQLDVPNLDSWVGYESAYYDYYSGKISHEEFIDAVHKMETVNTDWMGLLMQDTYSHNHSLSVSGGTDHIRYYSSVGFSNENGNIRGEYNNRYSAMTRLNLNFNKFSMQFGINGSRMKRKYTPSEIGVTNYAYNTSRSVPAYTENGDLWFYQKRKDNFDYNQQFSILHEQMNTSEKINTEQTGLNISLGYQIIPELKAEIFCSYNVSNSIEETFFGENTWYIANLKKENINTGEINTQSTLCPSGGELRMDRTKNESYSLRGSITFNKSFGDELKHNISSAFIGELSSSKYTGFKITKRGYMPKRGMIFDKIESMNEDNPYSAYNEWLLSDDARGVMKHNLTNLVGLIGTVTYSYKNSYIFNLNGRIDFSNKFGDASNEKLFPIWSVSGRWNLHENVLKNTSWVDLLALKLSFGYQGNMSALDSPKLIIKKEGTDKDFKEYYSTITNYPNPHLKWEKTSTFNVDLEFALFNNKVRGSVGYYYRYTKDAFLSKKVSSINGIEAYTVNAGNLRNQGYELTLNFTPINTATSVNGERKGFVWRFDPNFGTVINQLIDKVKRKDRVLQDKVNYIDYLNGRVQVAGRPVNTFYSYKFKGLNPTNGAPMFYGTEPTMLVDGKEMNTRDVYANMDREDVWMTVMEHSGCREPFLQGNINNYLGWRNWGLSFNLSYSIGSKIRLFKMFPEGGAVPGPDKNLHKEFVNRWRYPGDERYTNVPGILSGDDRIAARLPWWKDETYKFSKDLWEMYDYSNLRIASGNYLKLSSLSLRYVVPDEFCKKLRLQSLYVSLSGTNLFTICSKKLKGQDPSQSGSSNLINISVRPTYSLQLNVTF